MLRRNSASAGGAGTRGRGAGAPSLANAAPAPPTQQQQQQRSDRLLSFLSTLVTFPFAFLMAQSVATAGAARIGGPSSGGGIDTRARLSDFPEGRALLDIERWCREPVYSSWWAEALVKAALFVRQLLLVLLPSYPIVSQVLSHPRLLQALGLHPHPPLATVVNELMPFAQQQLANGTPQAALSELSARIRPNLLSLKAALEARHRLSRGPTPLERLDFFTNLARTASRVFFMWLRGLARAATYSSSLLSVVSGALSFTVVPSIILSVMSAALGVVQLLLMGTADLLEPAVNALLTLTETSKDTAASLGGTPEASPVGGRSLPPVTVEQMEGFFNTQLKQESGLLNRPEIPTLAGLNKPLLVKAYDLGLITAQGSSESRFIGERLALAESQNLLHVLWRAASRAAVAAPAFDVQGLVGAMQLVVEGGASNFAPALLGGGRSSLRHLFRADGFFAYADDRVAQAATVLLARLLSWLHLSQVVAPGSPHCLRFVLVLGESQAGKATLFSRLVDAPPEYAGQLGGGGGAGAPRDGTHEMASRDASSTTTATATSAPAVDMRLLAGHANTFVVCFPGLFSTNKATQQLAQGMAAAMGPLASAVVYLVHPRTQPSPDKLALLAAPLAAGCHCLIAINGPGRAPGLTGGGGGGRAAAAVPAAPEPYSSAAAGPIMPPQGTPLEALRGTWQSAAEALCAARVLPPSLLGVVVSDVAADGGEASGNGGISPELLPPGVHRYSQVLDWVTTTAAQAQRTA